MSQIVFPRFKGGFSGGQGIYLWSKDAFHVCLEAFIECHCDFPFCQGERGGTFWFERLLKID